MKIGILGSGAVGEAMAKGFMAEGHDVCIATREPNGEKADQLHDTLAGASVTDFATAAGESELAVLCVSWDGVEEAIGLIGADNLAGKVVIDTTNVITMVGDSMAYVWNGTSAAEQIQSWLPEAKVVKAFNTVGADLMYEPSFDVVPTMFLAGDDQVAKMQVSDVIKAFGWEPLDSGRLAAARELEAMAIVWIRTAMASNEPHAFKML